MTIVLLAVLMVVGAAVGNCEEVPGLMEDAAPLVLAGLVDLGATEWAFAAPGDTLKEGNPWGTTLTRRALLKAGTNAGAVIIVRRLRSTGHPVAAKWTKRGLVAAQLLAGGWAVHKGREARRLR